MEYAGNMQGVSLAFKTQYYWYAEAACALMPLFVALAAAENKSRRLLLSAAVLSSSALTIATQSRAMFLAGLIGLASFLCLCWLVESSRSKKLFSTALIGAAAAIVLVLQIPLYESQNGSTLERLAGTNEQSTLSSNMRRLMWGMALEGFYSKPFSGIGAGNYFSEYKNLRRAYSERDPSNPLLELNEALIPERAHSEPLQILSELGVIGLALFVWFLTGIFYLFLRGNRPFNLVSIGAFCGLLSFVASSLVTSYSFRFPTNGICFFFLATLLMGERQPENETDIQPGKWTATGVLVAGVFITLSMLIFSSLRGLSIYYLGRSNSRDRQAAEVDIKKAIAIDGQEPMFGFQYGQLLLLQNRYEESVSQLRVAQNNGLANSESFFTLGRILEGSGRLAEAVEIFEEGLRVYPRSVFLKTAYASFLKRHEQAERAEGEYFAALAINEKQARSWQLAHDEGLERLVQVARVDDRYVSTFDLKPESAPLTLVQFQETAP